MKSNFFKQRQKLTNLLPKRLAHNYRTNFSLAWDDADQSRFRDCPGRSYRQFRYLMGNDYSDNGSPNTWRHTFSRPANPRKCA